MFLRTGQSESDGCVKGLWILALALVAFGGCSGRRAELVTTPEVEKVWPEPPEPARIMYLGQILTENDLHKGKSLARGLGELVFGKGRIGVMVCPYAVAVDQAGMMFVADSGGAVIHMFDLRTRDYNQFASLADGQKLEKPVGLAVLADRLYVVDSSLGQVCVFKKDGTPLFAFGAGQFKRPSGIAASEPYGMIYVADTAGHTVYKFNADGVMVGQMGHRGLEPGQFNFPTHLCVDRTGRLYVSDTLNYRVQVFAPEGRFLMMFGQQGDRPGNFAHPCAVATDSQGNIYVTDRQYENIQIFNAAGQILMAFGQEGQGPGEFWLPGGIFIDHRDKIYVADSFNKRIQIFDLLQENKP